MPRSKYYRYTECGLDNVLIHGIEVVRDDDGDKVISIPNIVGLHKAIAESIVAQPSGMTGAELRFIRTELGLSQAELGKIVHKDHQSVGRWERGEHPMDGAVEALIRLHAIERLEIKTTEGPAEISALCVPGADAHRHVIDGRDPKNYRPLAA